MSLVTLDISLGLGFLISQKVELFLRVPGSEPACSHPWSFQVESARLTYIKKKLKKKKKQHLVGGYRCHCAWATASFTQALLVVKRCLRPVSDPGLMTPPLRRYCAHPSSWAERDAPVHGGCFWGRAVSGKTDHCPFLPCPLPDSGESLPRRLIPCCLQMGPWALPVCFWWVEKRVSAHHWVRKSS